MGITNYPGNKLLKRDVEVAKNYLNEDELNVLNRIVTAYLEVAELQALNQIPMSMYVKSISPWHDCSAINLLLLFIVIARLLMASISLLKIDP